MRPTSIVILGHKYEISYLENVADVDIYRREALFGQMDPWTRTIRIYVKDRKETDIIQTLIHEILHGIEDVLKLKCFKDDRGNESEELDLLASGLMDTLLRNHLLWFDSEDNWIEICPKEEENEDRELQTNEEEVEVITYYED